MAFDPVSLALGGASLLGGVFGKKRKHIDPEYLRAHFGPQAIAKDTTELANFIMNSPYGQQLLASAAESGQNFQTDMAARAAASGLDPSSGGQAGAGDFATSAAGQAQNTFERQTKQGFYEAAMPLAAQGVTARQNAYVNDFQGGGVPTDGASLWQSIGNAAGVAAAARGPGQSPAQAPAGGVAPMAATSMVAPAGNNSILARPAAGSADAYGFGGTGQANGLQPSAFSRKLSARSNAMRMTGQRLVQPAYDFQR